MTEERGQYFELTNDNNDKARVSITTFIRTHNPATVAEVAEIFGYPVERVRMATEEQYETGYADMEGCADCDDD